ncbi:uncharacterized protein B0H18DRAFT_1105321 [Fomitopsis serialis]|uniref:uncharacterized protein n=1 Tax=Fomitopsis serialis TaxID=139415 RepID=UPI002008E34D|nr:uncharacterized protein B0H18DRAFT_1105321 [Neoantrodia serialis]KAH9923526.1 hypothetical protein B0H18DRAFT_1105321 [Neoantrodia serialis]
MFMPTLSLPNQVLNETIGALLLSAIVGGILQGVTSCQTIVYYVRSQSDPVIVKSLVFLVWLLNALHTFLVTDTVYTYTVRGRSDPLALDKLPWMASVIILGNVIGDLGVKGIFSYRVWKLSRQWYLGVLIMTGALVTFAFGVFTMIRLIISPYSHPDPVSTYGTLSALAASDILMSVILGVVIWKHRSVFPSVNRVLRKVVLYSAETSLVTSVGSFIGLLLYATLPNALVYMAVFWTLPYLILGSVLFALNARESLRAKNTVGTYEGIGHVMAMDYITRNWLY